MAAITLLRLGVWPDLQTDAMASSITWVAANTGGPNVPKLPNLDLASVAITLSAGNAGMSRPNEGTDEPLIVNGPGGKRPSVPKIKGFLCCSARVRPKCLRLAPICHGRTPTGR